MFQIKIPKGIPAGGIRISVSGKNLAYIQNPQMYVYHKDKLFRSVSIPAAACAVLCRAVLCKQSTARCE
jgi:plexin A